jgi:hypothetical protein
MTAPTLTRRDYLRAPVLGTARPEGYKEWHHFIMARPGLRLLVNLSLTSIARPGQPPLLVPRVIVVAHTERWRGAVETFEPGALDISADLSALRVEGNRVAVGSDGYRVVIDLPAHGIAGMLDLVPTGRAPVVVVTNKPVGDGRLNWLFVPRLIADGWLRLEDETHRLAGAVAYHDHNWGRFRWGDDFGWTWGSILPDDPAAPWSFVVTRMTDRRRHRCLSQAVYAWRHDEQAALFRDASVSMRTGRPLGRPADCTLPPPMRLLLGDASDVPASIDIEAARAGDSVRIGFRALSHARLAQPSEVDLDRSVTLAEIGGPARVVGAIGGERIDVTGSGVFELLHG